MQREQMNVTSSDQPDSIASLSMIMHYGLSLTRPFYCCIDLVSPGTFTCNQELTDKCVSWPVDQNSLSLISCTLDAIPFTEFSDSYEGFICDAGSIELVATTRAGVEKSVICKGGMWRAPQTLQYLVTLLGHVCYITANAQDSATFISLHKGVTEFANQQLMHEAVRTNVPKLLQLLIDYGWSVDEQDSNGRLPLYSALVCGAHETTRFLKDKQAYTLANQGAVPRCPGIYSLMANDTGRLYVRQSNNVGQDIEYHVERLHKRDHPNEALQALYHESGESALWCFVLAKPLSVTSAINLQEWLFREEKEIRISLSYSNSLLNDVEPEMIVTSLARDEIVSAERRKRSEIDGQVRKKIAKIRRTAVYRLKELAALREELRELAQQYTYNLRGVECFERLSWLDRYRRRNDGYDVVAERTRLEEMNVGMERLRSKIAQTEGVINDLRIKRGALWSELASYAERQARAPSAMASRRQRYE